MPTASGWAAANTAASREAGVPVTVENDVNLVTLNGVAGTGHAYHVGGGVSTSTSTCASGAMNNAIRSGLRIA